jgi:hypothetical protein
MLPRLPRAVLECVAFELHDEIAHFLARTQLAFENRLQQRLEMHTQRSTPDAAYWKSFGLPSV